MAIPLQKSNLLEFLDKKNYLASTSEISEIEVNPQVVLISWWKNNQEDIQLIEPLIKKVINLGCGYFVCAGSGSEQLHDFIDDVILEMSFDEGSAIDVSNILTTWHDTDTNDEVADFFLHTTNVSGGLLAAFLDEENSEDNELKKAILNFGKQGV